MDFTKHIPLLLLVVLVNSAVSAQPDTAPKMPWHLEQLYGDFGIGMATVPESAGCMGAAANATFANHWGINIGFRYLDYKAVDLPADYSPGFCLFGSCTPQDNVTAIDLRLAREWQTGDPHIRFGLEAGPSYITYLRNSFQPYQSTGWFSLGSNYTAEQHKMHTIGASCRGRLQVPITPHFGIELAAFANVNRFKSFGAGELHLVFGYLRPRTEGEQARKMKRKQRRR